MDQFIKLASLNHFKAAHVRAIFPACLLIRALHKSTLVCPAVFSPWSCAVQNYLSEPGVSSKQIKSLSQTSSAIVTDVSP